MELTRSEERLIRQAATGNYERSAKWGMLVVAITTLFFAIRFATLEAHQEYMYLLGFAFLPLGFLTVMAMRFRIRSLQLIRKLRSAQSGSSADYSASSAVNNDLEGDV